MMSSVGQGKMIAVLPFVGKILEATKDSKSYRPSNPWIMGIMSLLAEIYAMDRLKLNLKFEIEMVFRSLGLQARHVNLRDWSNAIVTLSCTRLLPVVMAFCHSFRYACLLCLRCNHSIFDLHRDFAPVDGPSCCLHASYVSTQPESARDALCLLCAQISDVKASDLLAKRMRLVGADNPDFAVDKAALPPVPPRPEVAAATSVPLPRPPPSEPPGAAPIPQESVVLPGANVVRSFKLTTIHLQQCICSNGCMPTGTSQSAKLGRCRCSSGRYFCYRHPLFASLMGDQCILCSKQGTWTQRAPPKVTKNPRANAESFSVQGQEVWTRAFSPTWRPSSPSRHRWVCCPSGCS